MASINRGDNTGAFGKEFLRIYLNNPNNLYIQKAVFQINGNLEKEYYEPKFPLRVNFTGAETEQLEQINDCRLALWDESGRRRTAEGKFTFFVKENRIQQLDAPNTYGDEYYPEDEQENSVLFDLDDAEFAVQFKIDATPSKMSELVQDIPLMTPEAIVAGDNISTFITQDNEVVISAQLDPDVRWSEIKDKPTINGKPLEGDVEIKFEGDIPNTDWNATSGPAELLNKPDFKRICFTGHYNDIIGSPQIPYNTSQLNNDSDFITKNVNNLTNYYTKNEVEDKLDVRVDFTPVYDRIDRDKQETDTKFQDIETELDKKVDEQVLEDKLSEKADITYINDNLSVKANKKEIGNGTLNLSINGQIETSFGANNTKDAIFNVNVPTNLSELNNDKDFVTKEEVKLDSFVKQDELDEKLSNKANLDDIGHATLTIYNNGKNIGTFSSNAKTNKDINIAIPQNIGELNNDTGFITNEELNPIQEEITGLQQTISQYPQQITDLQKQVDNKVEKEPGKGLISQSEIDRISKIQQYDDTQIKDDITTIQNDIMELNNSISEKQNAEPGKGLSSNDFTNDCKNAIEDNTKEISKTKTNINKINEQLTTITDTNNALSEKINNVQTGLDDEIYARQEKYNYLQSQIEGMTARATVVDIVQGAEDLDSYDTVNLKNKDVICVLQDDTKDNRTTYYRWNGLTFTYVGAEGDYYTKSEANKLFVQKTFKINGYSLKEDIALTATDVHALPETTVIGDGTLTIQRNGEQLGTFSSNQVTNKAIDINVPTDTSQLTNGANFVNEDKLTVNMENVNASISSINVNLENANKRLDTLQGVITGDVSGLAEVAFTNSYNSLKDTPTIPTRLGQLQNDIGYVYTNGDNQSLDYILQEFAKEVKVEKVSELENDRGYLTSSAIGRGILTVKAQDKILGTWMANEKDDQEIIISIDNKLSETSENPVQNKVIYNELYKKAYDTTVVHITGDEEITGNKIISGNTTFTGDVIGVTMPTADNSTHMATTQYVQSQDYCTNGNAVHKTQDEEITGNKTFIGDVVLNNAIAITRITTDNSDNLATTKFVKDQQYAPDSTVVHITGDETINGDKTFAETTTFVGITNLGQFAHVNTPAETGESKDYLDLVTNVEFVNNKIETVDNKINTNVETLTNTINTNNNNCIHKTGNETLAGIKTFSSNPIITGTGININNNNDVVIQKQGTNFIRKASTGQLVISGTTNTIYLRPNGDTNQTGQLSIDKDGTVTGTKFVGALTGKVTGSVTGSSGSCTGNAATATKATQDGDGNNIVNTYATKTSLNSYVTLSAYNAKVKELTDLITNLTARIEALEGNNIV